MANAFRKLTLLLWKNFILQIRRPIGTAVEILLPFGLLALLILGRKNIHESEECFRAFDLNDVRKFDPITIQFPDGKASDVDKIAYYPINTKTTEILQYAADSLSLNLANKSQDGKRFTSEKEVLDEAKELELEYLCAIIFKNVEESKSLPKNVEYSIRFRHSANTRSTWRTHWVYPFFQAAGPRKETSSYFKFIGLQHLVDTGIIQMQTGKNYTAPRHIQQFPYPDYVVDNFILLIQGVMALIFVLAYMYTAVMIVKELVAEKQFRLKESMKMMGLANWIHWTAWFLKTLAFLLISVILQTILLKGGDILTYTTGGIVFFFLFLYILASIFFLFFISVLFSNAVRGMLFAAVIWFGSLGPYLSFQDPEKFEELSGGMKAASCLLPNSCLGIMIHIISQRESSQVGVTWDNLSENTSVDDNYTLGQAFGMLIFDCILYGILTWYIENVFPGEFGIPQPFYFPFLPSYWCGAKKESRVNSNSDINGSNKYAGNLNFEPEPQNVKIGVQIEDLRKVFKGAAGKKVAVDGLNLNMYKGQITALLGHNGAGKTTTMSILTGLFPPSSGKAYINGQSIESDMAGIRESLGLCPQHNVLFDRLTVKEHLEFFSALKGVPKKNAQDEIKQMITDIQLEDKAQQQSSTLSGGMKRKLNCAIALIGGSETVFLDEPTSGMDPYARRATWDLLQKYRGNKTIVLTTHFMDEADFLGDRIAIMADGELRCCGSSLYLKKRYGVGYHMTLVKGQNFQENKTRSLISEAIPSAKLVGNVGLEMSYILEEESTGLFKGLFEELEEKKDDYGISSFGISVTTLEEVFLKVGEGETISVEKLEENNNDKEQLHVTVDDTQHQISRESLLTGCALKATQFKAMFIKRFLNSKREKKAVLTQIVLPLLLVICGLVLSKSSNSQEDDISRQMSLSMLKGKSDVLTGYYSDFSSSPQSLKNRMKNMASNYLKSVQVEIADRTSEMTKIKHENNGSNVNLLYVENPLYKVVGTDKKECCDYKYFVLNKECRKALRDEYAMEALCGTTSKSFGYSKCAKSAFEQNSGKSFNNTDLTDWRTYFQEYVIEDSGKEIKNYFNEKVVGISVEGGNKMGDVPVTIWYSSQALHTTSSAYSAGSNIVLKYYMNDTGYGITTNNYPLPRNSREKSELNDINGSNLVLVMFATMAASFVAASFVPFIVTEKASKAKHIQFVSGVDSVSYWGASYCWDFINFLIPGIGMVILFAAFNLDDYKEAIGEVFLIILLFGLSALPFIYLISFLFQSALIAYAVISLLLVVASIAMVLAVFICRVVDEKDVADILHYVFLLVPTYAFPQALRDISLNEAAQRDCTASEVTKMACAKNGDVYYDNILEWSHPGVGVHCFYMFLEALIYFVLVLLIEEGFFLGAVFGAGTSTHFQPKADEDSDVREEREMVYNLSDELLKESAVVVKDLTKVYRTTGMTAVDHLSVRIPKAECFGLLGVNGAGKTTSFGMLTGELAISDGTAFLHGYNIKTQLKQVQQRIGYCPQFDALVERLTGREMLTMFARLRGIPSHLIEDVVKSAIEQLNLGKWADKLCGDYSGGNKRKLSTAMALVGDPSVVFLDEPTSGMDPASRRFLWDTLTSVVNSGRSIVLTSHSMEECEALCTRLVIMVNGQFKCIGSIQHLKSRFGQGYTLMMKITGNPIKPETIYDQPNQNEVGVANAAYEQGEQQQQQQQHPSSHDWYNHDIAYNVKQAKNFIQEKFPGSHLIEERQTLLQYQIINPDLRWSQMFGTLEEHAEQLGIIDYSVSQTSLEQVFINFAKAQHSEERVFKKSCCSCSCF
ncbi:phospholipid-transporting ATPase ABCA3-like [Hydractinia symbiolongicarpus]|uniref:phospholipid-transporting ATPase ABCA3-like n=1 Tax=Hydractinia symbiolongicarpus TaxID=13093 RepID=UPI00254B104E|nr:phospholipid-transporting ATPase ABCA3-like [Hydractinia symbiolongicarpus]XP_057304735.1 phospholipid-transporting ATPase ABCA3-like [Hydractinia symbiolongicarpus]XP_057304736.1 phospholipid-transporting ATPase ABCA3-like [Hydractinia symbiolongicarpus]XP_057304737.1 phospholipid-transporting ATPase ABCA3-like [Hydractinia symbiolongicarpus]XP_057304738.1 phospholipid-transporting ATPase ABCA3-like [Hydractinia symbiolongicarpus]